jgi:ACR3 family arsenite efflux pump ArsB
LEVPGWHVHEPSAVFAAPRPLQVAASVNVLVAGSLFGCAQDTAFSMVVVTVVTVVVLVVFVVVVFSHTTKVNRALKYFPETGPAT